MRISDWSSDVCSSDLRGDLAEARAFRRVASAQLALQAGVVELDVEDRHRRRRGGGRCGQRQREQQTGEQDGAAHPDTAHYEEGSTSIGQDCSNTLSSESTTRACRTSEPCGFTRKRKVGFSLNRKSPRLNSSH